LDQKPTEAPVSKTAEKLKLPEPATHPQPGSIPNWERWLMVELLEIQYGFAFESSRFVQSNEGMPLIRIRDISSTTTAVNYVGEYSSEYIVEHGDYLVGMDGDFNLRQWKGPRALLNQRVCRLHNFSPIVDAAFATLAIQAQLDAIHAETSFVTVKHLSAKQLNAAWIDVPPLAEQRRIVAKVEELLTLCNELEARQTAAREARTHLVRSALSHLTAAKDETEFRAQSAFFIHNSSFLLDDVPQLRQAILALAVQGRLVPQNPKEGPSKKVTVGDVVDFLGGYAFKSEWFQDKPGIRLVRNQNISHGKLDWRDTEYLPNHLAKEYAAFDLRPGDLVLSLNRPFISTGLKLAWVADSDCPCLLVQRVACLRPAPDQLLAKYLFLWCNAPHFYRDAHVVPSSGVPYIATNRVATMAMRLPPLAEQNRIVAKVDELMRWCDALEAHLTTARTAATHLLDASLRQLLTT
jgi:type I restriction enzyme S subunit